MGTRCRVVIYADSESEAASACGLAFDRIAVLEQVLSDYNPGSEASVLVGRTPGEWHAVSRDLAMALRRSQAVYLASGGHFDPTIGAATRLWRTSRRTGTLPSEVERVAALGTIGFHRLSIENDPDRVRFDAPGIVLDFGGIGKGLACDEAALVLRRSGIRSFLIDFGGDLLAGDPPPSHDEGWSVAVRDGLGSERMITLRNRAVATSGDTEQFIEIDGRRFSHIVDPTTGLGVERRIAATVIADHGWTADALASAACVGGKTVRERLEDAFPGVRIDIVTATD